MTARSPDLPAGPYTADQIAEGEPYELSNGYRIHCESGGGRHGLESAIGAQVLGSDPEAREAAVDTGFSWAPKMLRAPDVAVRELARWGRRSAPHGWSRGTRVRPGGKRWDEGVRWARCPAT